MFDQRVSDNRTALADEARWLVREMLPLGRCSVEELAQRLCVDRRTVHRHLARSGETFSSLVNDVRGELAQRYLEGGAARLADVSRLLGFSALSAFSRWHKRHFGFTLTQRRSGRWHSLAGTTDSYGNRSNYAPEPRGGSNGKGAV
jgi:AraC-like DNA-binding protein